MGLSGTYSGTYKSPPVVHKSDFNVQTRARSAQWADSVLPPSPRAAMQQEVGHLTSRERKPSLGKQRADLLGRGAAAAQQGQHRSLLRALMARRLRST